MKLKYLLFVVIPFMPLVLRLLYLPVEDFLLRDIVGWSPDAINKFASMMFVPVAFACSFALLIWMSLQIAGIRKRYVYLAFGTFLQVLLTLFCMSMYVFHGIRP
jgi:hypothetical protein